jgi:hypothetical protein
VKIKRVAESIYKDKADKLEASERKAAESIDVEFIPSESLLAVRTRERNLRTEAESVANSGSGNAYGGVKGILGDYVQL